VSRAEPLLSVVIVNWNGAGYLGECLESVRGGAGGPPDPEREWIVVDNGSSDASAALVAARLPEAQWLPLGENLGFATAANRGLARARGRFVLFLNPDARATEAALRAGLRVLEERPEVGLVSVAVRDAGGRVVPTVEPFFSLGALLRGRSAARASAPDGPGAVEIDWCHGAFLLGRRLDLCALAGFDERYFLYSEDMDLCFRMHESGRRVVYLPEVSIVHEGNMAGALLLGERRAAAIFASALLFYSGRHGKLAQLALRVAAAVTFGVRALGYRLIGSPLARRYAALAGAAVRGPAGAARGAQLARASLAARETR
jgi:GT2 family glycosyltransferase